MKNSQNVKLFAFSSVLLAISIILSYIENLLPSNNLLFGVRIGLSNICVVLGISIIGKMRTFIITILRVILMSLIFGSIIKFYISIFGFFLSFLCMCLYSNVKNYDIIVLSIIGGFSHILGQFIALIILLNNTNVLYILPMYLLLGIITGLFIGILSKLILKKLKYIL